MEEKDFQSTVMYFGYQGLSEEARKDLETRDEETRHQLVYANGIRFMLLLMNVFDY
jgi:hypothetical protein